MKTATFSNGYSRTYKGHREVRAAWMLADKETGETVRSGFSMDGEKARKTAEGYGPGAAGCRKQYHVPHSAAAMPEAWARNLLCAMKQNGHWKEGTKATRRTIWNAARQANAQASASWRDRVSVEVVTLD